MVSALRRISDGEFADSVDFAECVAALREVARAALSKSRDSKCGILGN